MLANAQDLQWARRERRSRLQAVERCEWYWPVADAICVNQLLEALLHEQRTTKISKTAR